PRRRHLERVGPGNRVRFVERVAQGDAHGFAVVQGDAARLVDEDPQPVVAAFLDVLDVDQLDTEVARDRAGDPGDDLFDFLAAFAQRRRTPSVLTMSRRRDGPYLAKGPEHDERVGGPPLSRKNLPKMPRRRP